MSRVRAKDFDSMQFFSVDGGKSTASEETQVFIRDVLTKKKLLFFWILSKLFSNLSTLEAILYHMAAMGGPKCPRKYLGKPV